jgi:nucleoid-associated protein YgaU
MIGISIGRMAVLSVALVATSGAALLFATTHLKHEDAAATAAAIAPGLSMPESGARDEGSPALSRTEVEAAAAAAGAAAAGLAETPSPRKAIPDASLPEFDIVRIERNGDAVVAGRAAPGATVNLLRNGERVDRATAGASGEFVMIPPRLPPGDGQLTLSAELPDGTIAVSEHSVAIALDAPKVDTAQSRAEQPSALAAATTPSAPAAATAPPAPAAASAPPALAAATAPPAPAETTPEAQRQTANVQHAAVSQPPHRTTVAPVTEPNSSSPETAAKTGTRIVSRGDSLWRISRLTYGVGTQFATIYNANRERIRDPDRIYPGQTFILPRKPR